MYIYTCTRRGVDLYISIIFECIYTYLISFIFEITEICADITGCHMGIAQWR